MFQVDVLMLWSAQLWFTVFKKHLICWSHRMKLLALAYNNRGHLQYLQVDFDDAVADYSQSIRLYPTLAVAHYNRGLIHYRLGELLLVPTAALSSLFPAGWGVMRSAWPSDLLCLSHNDDSSSGRRGCGRNLVSPTADMFFLLRLSGWIHCIFHKYLFAKSLNKYREINPRTPRSGSCSSQWGG